MPFSEQHKQQRSKNYGLLAILIAIIVVLFFLTMLKMSGRA